MGLETAEKILNAKNTKSVIKELEHCENLIRALNSAAIVFLSKSEINFKVDPDINLPVELEPGEKTLDPEKLSWEMILSGMLRLIAEQDKSGVPAEWIDYYRRLVLTIKPEIFHEFTGAAIVKSRNGEFEMALEISKILEGLFPGSPGVLLNKALILEKRAETLEKHSHNAEKENDEALEAYEAALSIKPPLPDTLFNAAFFFMRTRDFARARDCFSAYIYECEESEIQSELPVEKIKQAKKILTDINSQGLDDPGIREAHDCISRGNDEAGLAKIREFIERHPKVWNGWFILGWALRKLNRYENSLEAFGKAHELGGLTSDIRNEMAICLMELGDHKGARKELELALREDTENTKIISNLGVLAMKAGNREEADAYFRTVLELDPDDPLAKHFLNK